MAILTCISAFLQGFLSMGFQLVATRLLAPYFGSTLFVWSFVISTFLAAFSVGNMCGGLLSKFSENRLKINSIVLALVGLSGYLITASAGRTIIHHFDSSYDNVIYSLFLSCLCLFFIPVTTLAALLPIFTEILVCSGGRSGMSSGIIYCISTIGNIIGVMVTTFLLIPSFPTSTILQGWTVAAAGCFALFVRLIVLAAPTM